MTRRLLVVSYAHPPSPGIGGTRWDAMARYLRERGHSVTVVASRAWGSLPDDADLSVVRVGDLKSSRTLRRLLGRGDLTRGGRASMDRPPSDPFSRVLVPDVAVLGWLPPLVIATRRLLSEQTFDCLITTGPPESPHLIGLMLKRRPAWIADFRDGWTFESWREPFPTRPQRALDAWLERRVVTAADIVVGATKPIADDLRHRLNARAVWVSNGWDPASAPVAAPPTSATKRPPWRLVHTGKLSAEWGRSPEGLLRALHRVHERAADPPIRLVHAGPLSATDRALIDRTGTGELIEHLGTLDRPRALALQRSADALVLITSRNSSEATGKLFEYLGAGRPIVALAAGNEASRIVGETNTGVAVPPDDVDAIVAALRQVTSGELAEGYAPRDLERFIYPRPAELMAELVEEAIQSRSNRVSGRRLPHA